MIESIEFHNFRVLRDTTLPLSRCTLIVGPNGSGKTTVLQGLRAFQAPNQFAYPGLASIGVSPSKERRVEVCVNWAEPNRGVQTSVQWLADRETMGGNKLAAGRKPADTGAIQRVRSGLRVYALDGPTIAAPSIVSGALEIGPAGGQLAAVLDALRDRFPDHFDAIIAELGRWLPEFDRILFEVPAGGQKSLALRTRIGQHSIPASDLSQGTLIALALLTIAYLPNPPSLIGLEEPDRGIHPRLLRNVQEALYRLSYPEQHGEKREPVQVIATTHSPYFLDLFRDHPEEVVIANKVGNEVKFEPLATRADIREILAGAPLGEAWYTGVLGGVPSQP